MSSWHFLLHFLQDFHFRAALDNVFFALYPQENAISQRLVLIVTLFAITISGVVNMVGLSVSPLLLLQFAEHGYHRTLAHKLFLAPGPAKWNFILHSKDQVSPIYSITAVPCHLLSRFRHTCA
jgi:hypothetical protein